MQNQGAFGPYEGAFASRVVGQNLEILGPFSSVLAGSGKFRAGPGGVLQGRFAWGDPTSGLVLNSPTTPTDSLGVVIPLQNVNRANGSVIGGPIAFGGPQASWTWQTWDRFARAWRLREGIVCSMMNAGNFWLKFEGGAAYGATVYASQMDGSAISGALDGAVETPFKVCSVAGPGRLAMVSSTAKFF